MLKTRVVAQLVIMLVLHSGQRRRILRLIGTVPQPHDPQNELRVIRKGELTRRNDLVRCGRQIALVGGRRDHFLVMERVVQEMLYHFLSLAHVLVVAQLVLVGAGVDEGFLQEVVHSFHCDLAPLVLEGVSDRALVVRHLPTRIIPVDAFENVPDFAMGLRWLLLQAILKFEAVNVRHDLVVRLASLKRPTFCPIYHIVHIFGLQLNQIGCGHAIRYVPRHRL